MGHRSRRLSTLLIAMARQALPVAIACFPFAQVHAAYDIPQSVIAGGGGTSTNAPYAITGTIGQSILGQSAGGNYVINSGFWAGGAGSAGNLDVTVNVSIVGNGLGTVASAPAGISCPGTCGFAFTNVSSVSLNATPQNASSIFTGWLGACTGLGTCVITSGGTQNVIATFAPNDGHALKIDADENGVCDPLTDGVMFLRYMLGVTGSGLTANALGASPFISTPTAIKNHLDDIRPLLDLDGNGQVEAIYDGLILMRYLFGLRGDALITNALGSNPTRQTGTAIQNYLTPLLPP
jgi:hypothetical protein